jgi:hypothetical protein
MLTSLKFSAPLAASELQRRIKQVQTSLDKDPPGAVDSFADKLSAAVKQRLTQRPRAGFTSQAPDESFGRKLSDATKRLLANRGKTNQRPKYRPIKRRKPSKSD